MRPTVIRDMTVRDIRFPTTLEKDGSDAVNDPDYSCAYVTIKTDCELEGYGLTFTIGRGNDIVCKAIEAYRQMVVGRILGNIYRSFGDYWHELTQEPQLRWLGPEKGVIHLAVAAIVNALWDLWAKIEGKPVWKLLSDMSAEELMSLMDFSYIEDAISRSEALDMLKKGLVGVKEREAKVLASGYPAYTTSVGWLGYSNEKIRKLCDAALLEGFTRFKVKVGVNQEDDVRRIGLVREYVGAESTLMVDANQRLGVNEAIEWTIPLAKFNLLWIEEPTSPDDILGHAKISKALKPYGIGVATGEHCQNRTMFKQFLQAGALQFCQIDSCRMGGINEILTVMLMAAKFGVPVCPHAGGVGLCELVQHLSIFDFLRVSGTMENRVIEYVDHLHEHFEEPVVMKKGSYQVPMKPGYSIKMKEQSLDNYEYPTGAVWQKLFAEGKFQRP